MPPWACPDISGPFLLANPEFEANTSPGATQPRPHGQ